MTAGPATSSPGPARTPAGHHGRRTHHPDAPAAALAGLRPLVRLALRRDRVTLPVWVTVLGVLPAIMVTSFVDLYPTADSRAGLVTLARSDASLSLLYGPAFDLTSAGGFTAWRLGGFVAILAALMAIFTVTRHTRAEEDAGRADLLGSAVVGRATMLAAAVVVAAGASAAVGLVQVVALLGAGTPVAGSVAFGAATASAGVFFTGVAAVTAQLGSYARTASTLAGASLGAAFLLRAVGDTADGWGWLAWLSPVGWVNRVRPYAGERWWVLGLLLGGAVVLGAGAVRLLARRDLGRGLLPTREGPVHAGRSLSSPLGLAWRLHRGALAGWATGLVLGGLLLGGLTGSVTDLVGDSEQTTELFERLGGSASMVDAYLAAMTSFLAMIAALAGVQAVLRARAEESEGRLEPVLSTGVSRLRWFGSHLALAYAGSAAVLLLSGAVMALAARGTPGVHAGEVVLGVLVQVPAVWCVVGVATALVGLAPRHATLGWAAAGLALALAFVGPMLGLAQWVLDVSPFVHVPKVPGHAVDPVPLLWLGGAAVALLVAGVRGMVRRDVSGG